MLEYIAGGEATTYQCAHIRCTAYEDRLIIRFKSLGDGKDINLKVTSFGEEAVFTDAQGKTKHIVWSPDKASGVEVPEEFKEDRGKKVAEKIGSKSNQSRLHGKRRSDLQEKATKEGSKEGVDNDDKM